MAAPDLLSSELDEQLLLDPPDPVDILIAHTASQEPSGQKSRPLDFVRAKFQELKRENSRLKERVADLEQTLSIVQTAQEWSMGKGMTLEQAEKMREIKALLEQAKKAREELNNFSSASRAGLFEKLRACKAALKREREEKREMKDRLLHAFDHARAIRDKHHRLVQQRQDENDKWQEVLRDVKERHRRELRRLQGDEAAMASDRTDQLSHFGEQVIGELTRLQQHLREVRQETVDAVILEGDDFDDLQWGPDAGMGDAGDVRDV